MTEFKKGDTWETIGHVTVDAGVVVVSDAGAVYSNDFFVDADWPPAAMMKIAGELPYGKAASAVFASSGYGDGRYPVQVRYCEGDLLPGKRVAEMRIVFIDTEE